MHTVKRVRPEPTHWIFVCMKWEWQRETIKHRITEWNLTKKRQTSLPLKKSPSRSVGDLTHSSGLATRKQQISQVIKSQHVSMRNNEKSSTYRYPFRPEKNMCWCPMKSTPPRHSLSLKKQKWFAEQTREDRERKAHWKKGTKQQRRQKRERLSNRKKKQEKV